MNANDDVLYQLILCTIFVFFILFCLFDYYYYFFCYFACNFLMFYLVKYEMYNERAIKKVNMMKRHWLVGKPINFFQYHQMMKSILNSIIFVSVGSKTKKWWMCPPLFEDFMTNQKCNETFHNFGGLRCDHKRNKHLWVKTW